MPETEVISEGHFKALCAMHPAFLLICLLDEYVGKWGPRQIALDELLDGTSELSSMSVKTRSLLVQVLSIAAKFVCNVLDIDDSLYVRLDEGKIMAFLEGRMNLILQSSNGTVLQSNDRGLESNYKAIESSSNGTVLQSNDNDIAKSNAKLLESFKALQLSNPAIYALTCRLSDRSKTNEFLALQSISSFLSQHRQQQLADHYG